MKSKLFLVFAAGLGNAMTLVSDWQFNPNTKVITDSKNGITIIRTGIPHGFRDIVKSNESRNWLEKITQLKLTQKSEDGNTKINTSTRITCYGPQEASEENARNACAELQVKFDKYLESPDNYLTAQEEAVQSYLRLTDTVVVEAKEAQE